MVDIQLFYIILKDFSVFLKFLLHSHPNFLEKFFRKIACFVMVS